MPQSPQHSGTRWKLGIALLICIFLVGMAVSLVTAARRVSRVVDTDYYSHGLHYGDTQDRAKNAGLSWTLKAELSGSELRVQVRDQAGVPVTGGTLGFQPQEGAAGQPAGALALAESAPGDYRAQRPAPMRGEVHGTLRFTKQGAVASQKLVLLN